MSLMGKLAYSAGNLGSSLLYQAFTVFIIYFYTDIVMLDPSLVGIGFVIYGIWNAINDPVIGHISDRTRTRWGRRIPYILFGILPLLLTFILVWAPQIVMPVPLAYPHNIQMFIYFLLIISAFDWFYTLVILPYVSLFPEMFGELKDRAEVQLYRQFFAIIGLIFAFVTPPLLVGVFSGAFGKFGGWTWMGITLGIIGCASLYTCLLGSREKREFSMEEALPFLKALKASLVNKSFLTFLVANLAVQYTWILVPAMVPFYVKYILGLGEMEISILLLAVFLTAIPAFALWRKICVVHGVRKGMIASMLIWGLCLLPLFVATSYLQALVVMFLIGVGLSGLMMIIEILISDVIDEDEINTGVRREGMYFGLNAFIIRFGYVLAGLTTAVILGMTGYVPEVFPQPELASLGIRSGISIIPCSAMIAGLIAMKYYPLHGEKLNTIKKSLTKLHEEKAKRLKSMQA